MIDATSPRRQHGRSRGFLRPGPRVRTTLPCPQLASARVIPPKSTNYRSGVSALNHRVEALELDAGGGGAAPGAGAIGGVARVLPGGDLAFERVPLGQAPVQALRGEHAQLDLGHRSGGTRPAAVRGGVVDLQLVRQPLRLRRREGLVQGASVAERRDLVTTLVARGVSERLACRTVGFGRASYRYRGRAIDEKDRRLRALVITVARQQRR